MKKLVPAVRSSNCIAKADVRTGRANAWSNAVMNIAQTVMGMRNIFMVAFFSTLAFACLATHFHSPHYLRVFVNRVRQKLEPDPARPRYLHTATGLGLVFKLHHEPESSEDSSSLHQEVP